MTRALSKTEEAYLEMADKPIAENPKLAVMGFCVLVMPMKKEEGNPGQETKGWSR